MSKMNHDFDMRGAAPVDVFTERRSTPRLTPTLRIGKLLEDGSERLCIIRNISPTGLMVQSDGVHEVGGRVEIEAKSDHILLGTIMWVKGDLIGVRFDGEANVQEILTTSTMPGSRRARPPRMKVDGQARIRVGDEYHRCDMIDISQGGIKVSAPDLPTGKEATVILRGLQPVKATVRWAHDGAAGLSFHKPIQFDALLRWLDAHNKPNARAA